MVKGSVRSVSTKPKRERKTELEKQLNKLELEAEKKAATAAGGSGGGSAASSTLSFSVPLIFVPPFIQIWCISVCYQLIMHALYRVLTRRFGGVCSASCI